jgi:hypothetical protein
VVAVSLSAAERETVIVMTDEDGFAEIYTAQRRWITKLKKNPAATLVVEGKHDGSAWARFEVPKELVSVRAQSRKGQGKGRGRGQLPPGFTRSETGDQARVFERDADVKVAAPI